MDKFYRDLIEIASFPSKDRSTEKHSKYFGKMTVSRTVLGGKNVVFDISVAEELFHNDLMQERLIKELRSVLTFFIDRYSVKRDELILVAALGNDKISADSIASAVCDKLTVTSHLYSDPIIKSKYGNLAAIKCGVSGNTGIQSFDILTSIARAARPKMILAVDALASNSVKRLGNTVQVSDRGIEPGGGVGNAKPSLNADTLGCPVVAVGVPLVIYAVKILKEFLPDDIAVDATALSDLVVTAKEIDFLVSDFSRVIAESINQAVHRAE